ncbi:MAG: SUMF1/EgtB/PvdO family nonheme iron enzyme [Planctomycetales bacterium]|nr:SUMF1/EgtB/PvdO family nonheme iron enzyme [Planctomycetales bacterium]
MQPCYERTGTKEKGGSDETLYDAWRVIPGATGYRLLHEAEWEYACRAGTSTVFSSGDDETLLVGYCQMYPSKLTAVCGEKLPNAWGLHDVHGNVWEWCADLFGESDGSIRVIRGGGWDDGAADCIGERHRGTPPHPASRPPSPLTTGEKGHGPSSYTSAVISQTTG